MPDKVCKYCGAIIRSEAKFCDICGKEQEVKHSSTEEKTVVKISSDSDIKKNLGENIDEDLIQSEINEIKDEIKVLIMKEKNQDVADKYQYLANLAFELGKDEEAEQYIKKAKYFLS
ncbi:MAG: hypothetical protein GF329_05985 [Candidatus Lokiarchaeota archaeon]|nr:hypothetical protein [Candidatus Lokiarchaeota archaeon]